MTVVSQIWQGLDWSWLADTLLGVIPALVCIVLHELGHGVVALWLGDDTARRAGRLTLNPLRHVDWYGLVMMALFHVGWAKAVPVNMYRFRHPRRGMALTALAGPVVNLLLAALALLLYGFLWPFLYESAIGMTALKLLALTAQMSVGLMVFNLIPIPPLDGSKVLFSVLGDALYDKLMRYERYGMIVLVILVLTGAGTGVLNTGIDWVLDRLYGLAMVANRLSVRLL